MRLSRRRLMTTALATAIAAALAAAAPASAAPVPLDSDPAGATLSTTGQAGTVLPATDPTGCNLDPAVPKRQLRAMWVASVTNIDWPTRASGTAPDRIARQQAEYRGWLDLAQRLNHNAVIVQVRPTADAFWPSPFEPWSEYLVARGARGQDPGWDPLAFLVDEAHQRNLEFHAWFNPYRVSMPVNASDPTAAGADINRLAPDHPARAHPDWVQAYPVNVAGSRLYYNPGIPEVRRFVQDAMMDAVTRYDIDGVHFDDYFYPYPAAGQDFADDATFAQYGAGFTSKGDWRRHNINLLVQEFGLRIKAAKPWVKFGISPFGIWRNRATDPLGSDTAGLQSYDAIYADTRTWVKQEWVDYILPQVYWHIGLAIADYAKLVPWWADVVAGTRVHLYIGQADYKIGEPAQPAQWHDPYEMSRHLTFNRAYPQVLGNVHFSAVQVRANKLGATDIYAAAHYSRPALVPAMPHLPASPLVHPVVTDAERESTGAVRLTWRPTAAEVAPPFGEPTGYAVYRFDGLAPQEGADPCGFADAAHLLATVRATGAGPQSFVDSTAQPGRRYTYYVSGLDRLWNESEPSPPRLVF